MNVRTSGDIPTILYLIPFIGAGLYSIFLWAESGVSLLLPGNVYLTVTRDPTLFVIGSLAVLFGVVLEVRSAPPDQKWTKVLSVSDTVQSVGVASLVLALISALYANGGDPSGAAGDVIVGRYDVVFPALLFLLSYLMRIQFQFSAVLSTRFFGIVAMILVPATLYGLNKLKSTADLPVAFVFLVIGLALFLWPQRKNRPAKET
jgi:hypothetical protein